jgi:hypothetical protein
MKMRNDDLKKITEIKQYLLDPPVSFKLHDYAQQYVQDAVSLLANYPDAKNIMANLQNLAEQLTNRSLTKDGLRGALKQAGIQISSLTNK